MNNRHTANTVNAKATLSILGIVGLIVGALFLAGFLQPNLFILPLAYGQPYYYTTTGNYGEPDNPNNADNIIIKYCLDHANLVAAGQNVVQDLVSSGMVPSYYDGKTCQQVNQEHTLTIQENALNKRLEESRKSLLDSLASDDPTDEITKKLFNDLPSDVQDKILDNLN
ncbi:MAG: hypothetical protein WA421_02450 [Nitrososphaeraceae archaeon]